MSPETLVLEFLPVFQGMMIGFVTGVTLTYMCLRPVKPRYKNDPNKE